ncbi:alpha/beta hydrolase [Paenibacillus hemerocallicola]|uniref:Alpha/beta hydrolase n=1 Tax=Paenibacillus hemerocallicola TaxID=1172614 RepID=A0A5C4T538_9BACL|nr:alpha/beta hydrolase [Paenibacillus hemerocallicola]TNJ63946.1 alpha/beta hydrolase [Paenibacillus hemerocallicola]
MELITRYYDEDIVLKRAVDIACPTHVSRRVALFYIHGGGWRAGARDGFHRHLYHFSRKGYVCASAGYRLAPTVHFTEQMGDVAIGYDRFLAYIRERELMVDRVIVAGSSAGAHLASLLALTDPAVFNPGIGLTEPWLRPIACVSINGPATLEKWEPMHDGIKRDIENMLGVTYEEESALFRKASPSAYVEGEAADFLFIIAGKEKFFPHSFIYEMSGELQRLSKRSEVVLFPEAEHGFFYGIGSPLQQEALTVLEPFLESYA